jgi:ABC-type sugar transport system substrate-binding protein
LRRVVYIDPMRYGTNAAVDAVAHGLDHRLSEHGIDLRVAWADFADPDWRQQADMAVRQAVDEGAGALVIWITDPQVPAAAIADARAGGVPVVTLERPNFPVDASVVYPNFNQGTYMSEYLGRLLRPGAHVAVVGGPDVVDDIELNLGLLHGLRTNGLTVVNDSEDPRYKNTTDLEPGGRTATANILADFPRLDGLIPFNDETALGAIEALRDAGRLGEMKTVSRNGTPQVVAQVLEGNHAGTWDIDAPGIGATAADLVARIVIDGEDLDGLCVASPIGRMITPERAVTWVPWSQRIPLSPLRPVTSKGHT